MGARANLGPQFQIEELPIERGEHTLIARQHGVPADAQHSLDEHEVGALTFVDQRTHLEIGWRATHPQHQRQGIGTALQDALERRAAGRPIISMDISDSALALHQSYVKRNPRSTWKLGSHTDV